MTFKDYLIEQNNREALMKHYDKHHDKRTHGDSDWANRESNQHSTSAEFNSHMKHFYPHKLDPQKLAKLPGANGEHNHQGKPGHWNDKFEKVKSDMKKHGFRHEIKDGDHSYSSGVMIKVHPDRGAVVHEGNKRLRAAAALGHTHIPVRWEWAGKAGHDKSTAHPVDYMHDDDKKHLAKTGKLHEEAPANAAGGGNIAGIGVGDDGEPGVNMKKSSKETYREKNKKEAPKGLIWKPVFSRKSLSQFMRVK